MTPEMIEAIEVLVETMKQDYIAFAKAGNRGDPTPGSYFDESIKNFKVEAKEGKTYIKLISDGSVRGFIVKKPTKGFEYGDLLKAASWNSPATNFKRGNIFTDAKNPTICRWTGIM